MEKWPNYFYQYHFNINCILLTKRTCLYTKIKIRWMQIDYSYEKVASSHFTRLPVLVTDDYYIFINIIKLVYLLNSFPSIFSKWQHIFFIVNWYRTLTRSSMMPFWRPWSIKVKDTMQFWCRCWFQGSF